LAIAAGTTSDWLETRLQLPAGAQVTAVEVNVSNAATATSQVLNLQLEMMDASTATFGFTAALNTNVNVGSGAARAWITATGLTAQSIPSNGTAVIVFKLLAGTGGSFTFYGMRLTYTSTAIRLPN
jgi:hypothetical protein